MQKNLKSRFVLLLFIFILELCPSSVLACNVRQYAIEYVDIIYNAVGGDKPNLIIKKGSSKDEYAYYLDKKIYIYKDDYKGKCENSLPMLKSIIAHEYGHHIEKDLRKVSQLRGERLVLVAEHSIADQLLGGAKYDNKANLKYSFDYEKIKKYLVKKQNKKILANSDRKKILFKSKK